MKGAVLMKNVVKKKVFWVAGVIAIIAVMGFALTACDDAGTSVEIGDRTYSGKDALGGSYKVIIFDQSSRAVYDPVAGDAYELTYTPKGKPAMKSVGTIKNIDTDGNLILEPEGATTQEFTVFIDGGQMVAIGGSILYVNSDETEILAAFAVNAGPAISGNTIASNVDVVYADSLDPLNTEKAHGDLTFKYVLSMRTDDPNNRPRGDLINDALTAPATIKVTDGKATIIVPPVKPELLRLLIEDFPIDSGVIIIPDTAKFFGTEGDPAIFADDMDWDEGDETFYANDNTIGLVAARNNKHIVGMTYVDRDAVMKGGRINTGSGGLEIMDVVLKKGWNYHFFTFNGPGNKNVIYTASTRLPSNYKWTIADHLYFEDLMD